MDSPMTILVVLAVVAIIYLLYTSRSASPVTSPMDDVLPIPPPSPAPASQSSGGEDKRVVLFFAPWCGHCKSVVPIWDQLAQKYPNVIKIDCDQNPEIAKSEQVSGFPTIRAYVNNQYMEYQGDRSPESLEQFVASSL